MESENIFNIFFHHGSTEDEVSEYFVKCYSVFGTDDEKMFFLRSCVFDDFNIGTRFEIRVKINENIQNSIPLRLLTTLMSIQDYAIFEQAFVNYGAPENPLVLFTHVIDREPQITLNTKKVNSNTINALVARGIDNYAARMLVIKGLNLKILQKKSVEELKMLRISDHAIHKIHKSTRPPIPEETVVKLLYESRRTCCVCRDSSKPIIIHHIEDWSSSRSHDIENLIVLCLEHHDLAHTKKELSLNLDKKQLISFKKRWLDAVKFDDSRAVLNLINDRSSRWDYFNLNRIFELFFEFNINFRDIKTFPLLRNLNILNEIGTFNSDQQWKVNKPNRHYFSDFGEGIMLNYYLKIITERIVEKLELIDLTNKLTKTNLTSLLSIGSYFTVQSGFYFTDYQGNEENKIDLRRAYYRGKGIVIEFIFESFNCSSSSAKYNHLTSHNIINPILYLKSIKKENGKLIIGCSCLAIGSYFDNSRIQRRGDVNGTQALDDDFLDD